MTLKHLYEKYLRENFVFEDPEELITLCSDMIDMYVEHLKKVDPEATKHIARFELASYELYSLIWELDTEV